jgi:hypothetical protein
MTKTVRLGAYEIPYCSIPAESPRGYAVSRVAGMDQTRYSWRRCPGPGEVNPPESWRSGRFVAVTGIVESGPTVMADPPGKNSRVQ